MVEFVTPWKLIEADGRFLDAYRSYLNPLVLFRIIWNSKNFLQKKGLKIHRDRQTDKTMCWLRTGRIYVKESRTAWQAQLLSIVMRERAAGCDSFLTGECGSDGSAGPGRHSPNIPDNLLYASLAKGPCKQSR